VADIETISLYNWLHQPQIATVCISATEAWLSHTDLVESCCRQYAEFLVVKAETLLFSNQVTWHLFEIVHSIMIAT